MKYKILLILTCIILSGCSHWKWIMKHQDDVCAKCPQTSDNTNMQTDTTVYTIIPADTVLIEGLDFPTNDGIVVDNSHVKIIKEKGKTIVIYKDRKVPVTVTKYFQSQSAMKIVKVKEVYIPKWFWILLYGTNLFWIILIVYHFVRKLFK